MTILQHTVNYFTLICINSHNIIIVRISYYQLTPHWRLGLGFLMRLGWKFKYPFKC